MKVRVLDLVALVALKMAVTPAGRPVALSATVPLKPFCPLTLIAVAMLEAPVCRTLTAVAEEDSVKPGTTIDSEMVAVLLRLPETPVTVSG